jgi:hypothetical protein
VSHEHHRISESSGATLGLEKNEVVLDGKSSFHDPVKYRGSSRFPYGWLVAISGDVRTGDDIGDPRYEKGFFGIRHDDDFPKETQAYEFALYVQEPGGTEDATMKCRLRVTSQYMEVNGQRLVSGGVTDTMWAPDGMCFTQQQADGNFVTYHASAPWSKAHAKAVWSAWTGKL